MGHFLGLLSKALSIENELGRVRMLLIGRCNLLDDSLALATSVCRANGVTNLDILLFQHFKLLFKRNYGGRDVFWSGGRDNV